jgi:hypothetical protein
MNGYGGVKIPEYDLNYPETAFIDSIAYELASLTQNIAV